MTPRLFGGSSLSEEINRRLQAALTAVGRVDPDRLLHEESVVIDEIVDHYALEPVSLDWDGLNRDEIREVLRGPGQGQAVTFYVPTTGGDRDVWIWHPSHFYPGGLEASLLPDGRISFTISGRGLTADGIAAQVDRMRIRINEQVAQSTGEIATATTALRGYIAQRSGQRRAKLEQNKALDAALAIPLRATAPDRRVEVPVKRKEIRVAEESSKAPTGSSTPPGWHMADAIYEDVVRTIRALGNAAERLPRTSSRFNEEELRDLVLFVLNSNYEGGARGEVFNGNGKTDILLPWEDGNAFIGECKVWDGPSKFNDAIDQLLGYAVWRDTKAALVIFIRDREPTATIDKADAILRMHDCFVRAGDSPTDPTLRRDYVMHHADDSERLIQLAMLSVVIRESAE